MPAGMVRPRASLAPVLGLDAIAQYRTHGWNISPFGKVGSGVQAGACARCGDPCVRYGPIGSPLCDQCRRAVADV